MIYIQAIVSTEGDMRVSKWGNSLAVRLPASVIQRLALKEGDQLELAITDDRSVALTRPETKEEFIAAMRALQRPLPPDYKFDREWANSRCEDDD